jgi:hypothetical protein
MPLQELVAHADPRTRLFSSYTRTFACTVVMPKDQFSELLQAISFFHSFNALWKVGLTINSDRFGLNL